ncbi:MAG: DUF2460 domain-containing protein [Candidatus Margulisiibacteriota bacterium]
MSDFNWLPDFVFEETLEYKTMISEFENGSEQRRRKWSNPNKKWQLRFTNKTKQEMEAIRDFFKSRYGAFLPFVWDNPNDGLAYTVRFDNDSFKFQLKAFEVYDFEFEFTEVR